MSRTPWRVLAEPHEDVLKGTFKQSEFAADLSLVHAGKAPDEYQRPDLFFQRTFITEGMALLLDSVVKRLTGKGGDPVIQLQTAFGGGKTHTMMAVYHLAKGERPTSDLPGIGPILDRAGVTTLPKARVVVLDGVSLGPNVPRNRDGVKVHTLWGELAFQLGGRAAYERVQESDLSGTSPGKELLAGLLADYAPCVILVDELVRYVAQFEQGRSLAGGTLDSNLSFIQALTEALKVVPTAVMLASLPESEREAGSTQRGVHALDTLSRYFGRVQALWKPVATEEAFEIVRRRLFTKVRDEAAMEAVCRLYADYYTQYPHDFPAETQEATYFDRLKKAYPIHPEVFDRLYEDWSSLDNFQRTRGVLKLMAQVIHRLWQSGNQDLLIMPGSLPLNERDVKDEIIYYLPQGWDPVIDRDIDGPRSEPVRIEQHETRFGALQACRRATRTIFLGSAPSTKGQLNKGIEGERVLLGAAQPDQPPSLYKDAIKRLIDRLHYLNTGNSRLWFDTRPNLRREMEERKRRFDDREHVQPLLQKRVQKRTTGAGSFVGVHVFTASQDVPDDTGLRLVILDPNHPHSKGGQSFAVDEAKKYLRQRGDQPRLRQNRLIFLAADYDTVARLKDHAKTYLAWESIVKEIELLNLDAMQARQARKGLDDADEFLDVLVREAYRWVLAPEQDAVPGRVSPEPEWVILQAATSAGNLVAEVGNLLEVEGLLISRWAPVHLAKQLKQWYWKEDQPSIRADRFWQDSCSYLYLPRLKDQNVLLATISDGAEKREFGVAQSEEEGKYHSFTFGKGAPVYSDILLIEPGVAEAYAAELERIRLEEEARRKLVTDPGDGIDPKPDPDRRVDPKPEPDPKGREAAQKKHYYGTVELIDPVTVKMAFATIVDEVVAAFALNPANKVTIHVEIVADSPTGFDERTVMTVVENTNTLKFKESEFREDE